MWPAVVELLEMVGGPNFPAVAQHECHYFTVCKIFCIVFKFCPMDLESCKMSCKILKMSLYGIYQDFAAHFATF
jgi:hypothetical protein